MLAPLIVAAAVAMTVNTQHLSQTRALAAEKAKKHDTLVAPAHEMVDGARPKPKPKPKPKAPAPAPVAIHHGSVFSGLGAWVDLYDIPVLNAERTVATLRAAGVQTLYLQTGRSDTKHSIEPGVLRWLITAHRAGLNVVGWYLPYYSNVRFDTQRSVAVARFSWHGIRFDGVGIDIEFKGAVKSNAKWNRYVVLQLEAVRRALGPAYPLAAIPPPPLQMRLAPRYWAGFPWRGLARSSSDIMLMSYWSFFGDCPRVRLHCPYEYTRQNVLLTRRLTGGRVPIHIIGGVGDGITDYELGQFIQGARAANADGASIYDVATTKPRWWRTLRYARAFGR
jgi:hypothetical protein